MKTFNEFIRKAEASLSESPNDISVLNYDGSFASVRKNASPFISPPGFGEIRKNKYGTQAPFISIPGFGEKRKLVKAKTVSERLENNEPDQDLEHAKAGTLTSGFSSTSSNFGHGRYHSVLNHPLIAPNKGSLSEEHIAALRHYTSNDEHEIGSASILNGHARELAGEHAMGDRPMPFRHDPADTKKRIKLLSSMYTPEATNKVELTLHTGIPLNVSERIKALKPGHTFVSAGATSASIDPDVAGGFGEHGDFLMGEKNLHLLRIHAPGSTDLDEHGHPHGIGTVISAAQHSSHDENELLFQPGQHFEKIKTDTSEPGVTVHHIRAIPGRVTKLEDYPNYK